MPTATGKVRFASANEIELQLRNDNTASFTNACLNSDNQKNLKERDFNSAKIREMSLVQKWKVAKDFVLSNPEVFRSSSTNFKYAVFGSFRDISDEDLFHLYIMQQKVNVLPSFVISVILYLVVVLALQADIYVKWGEPLSHVVVPSVSIVLTILSLAVFFYGSNTDMRVKVSHLCYHEFGNCCII